MSENSNDAGQAQILEIAWRQFAELDANATEIQKWHLTLRLWVIIFSVLATLLAILTQRAVAVYTVEATLARVLNFVLIAVPIVGSVLLAFASKLRLGERWLALRAGAEEIRKDIYLYRTVWSTEPDRDSQLKAQLKDIQLRLFESVEGNLVLKPYRGPVPPRENQEVTFGAALIHLHRLWPKVKQQLGHKSDGDSPDAHYDAGFDNLSAPEYVSARLGHQIDWHTQKMVAFEKNRNILLALIFVAGGAGTILAAVGLNIMVALTASLAAAFTAWTELRRYDDLIKNYSKVALELKSIRDDWLTLKPEQQTEPRFFQLVEATEGVLWSQHQQFISTMRQGLAALQAPDGDTAATAPAADTKAASVAATSVKEATTSTQATPEAGQKTAAAETPEPKEPEPGSPHAFVVMPFGRKQDAKGRWIDFDSVYRQLIRPALIEAGFEPFRADEESVSGDILTDMFQELLLADLVIADLSIDNANAFYELGVRHALRRRGVVHIQSGRAYMPFDVFNVRTIPYHTTEDGRPDPAFLAKDIQTIAKVAADTWVSDVERVHSPIFNLLTGLAEPDRAALRTPLAAGYWREYNVWRERVDIARRQNYIGDVLLLTEEVRNPLIREEAINQAAKVLSGAGHHALAHQQYRRGLEINPKNLTFRREEAFELGRLKRRDEAVVKLERLVRENGGDSETLAFLGKLYKDMWHEAWHNLEPESARLQAAFEASFILKRSVDTYLAAYCLDQRHFYSGINALTLLMVLDHLQQQFGQSTDLDPEIEALRQRLPALTGAVQFALEQGVKQNQNDFWAFASLGDLAVNTATRPQVVTRAYRKALALGAESRYKVQSVLGQLQLLQALNFRPNYVQAGIAVLQEALDKMGTVKDYDVNSSDHDPVQVFLCAGHMIDRPGRPDPRFPAEMEEEVRQRIDAALTKLNANANDMVITPGVACGGDILFIEACLQRGLKVDAYLPFAEARFIEESVSFAGDHWVERFYQIRQHPNVTFHLQPERVGPVPAGDNPYARNSRWALYSTLCYGIERVRLIVLWDGKGGDGPGGTGYMVKEVRQMGGIVEHLNTTKFDHWQKRQLVEEMTLS